MNFWREFSIAGGQEKYFYSASGSQFVATGPAKFFKISQKIRFYGQNEGEVIHDCKFLFLQ